MPILIPKAKVIMKCRRSRPFYNAVAVLTVLHASAASFVKVLCASYRGTLVPTLMYQLEISGLEVRTLPFWSCSCWPANRFLLPDRARDWLSVGLDQKIINR